MSTSKQRTGGKLWEAEKANTHPLFDMQLDMFLGLAAELIPLAAMTFPSETGFGHDNIAPRSLARLSPDAIRALAELYVAFERFGEWVDVLDLVLIVFLPKNEGGYRPIGLFPTVIREWFRVRLITVQTWATSCHQFSAVREWEPRKRLSESQ